MLASSSTTARRFLRRSRRRQVVAVASVTTLVALTLLGTGSWAVPGLQRTYWRSAAGKLNPPIAVAGGTVAIPELGLPPTVVPGVWIDRHEVTNAQYRYCVRANRCNEPRESFQERSYSQGGPTMPVVNVSAIDAQAFCSFIGRRLPTAAEWLWAATRGSGGPYPWGKAPPTPAHANVGASDPTEPDVTELDPPDPEVPEPKEPEPEPEESEPEPTEPESTEPGGPVPVDGSDFAAGRTPEGIEHLLGNVQEWVATGGRFDDDDKVRLTSNWDLRDGAAPLSLMGGSYIDDPVPLTELVEVSEASLASDVSGFRCVTTHE